MFGEFLAAAIGAFKAFEEGSKAFQLGVAKFDEYLAWQKAVAAQKLSQDINDIRTALNQPTTGAEKDELAKKLSGITSRL